MTSVDWTPFYISQRPRPPPRSKSSGSATGYRLHWVVGFMYYLSMDANGNQRQRLKRNRPTPA